jgi:hypothetical protein
MSLVALMALPRLAANTMLCHRVRINGLSALKDSYPFAARIAVGIADMAIDDHVALPFDVVVLLMLIAANGRRQRQAAV